VAVLLQFPSGDDVICNNPIDLELEQLERCRSN
jgi:hypothetical protein